MIKTLIVDDHPAMIEGYKTILKYTGRNFEYNAAYDCESAYRLINSDAEYDLVLVDINLPPYSNDKVVIPSGLELAVLARSLSKKSKLVILTSHSEVFLLYSIIKKVYPDGLLVKSDFSADELIYAIENIISGKNYYTSTAKNAIKEINSKVEYLDTYNRQIISLLSNGIKTRNLPIHLNLSLSAIDKRKALIKTFLNVEKGNDEDIIREAKKLGFI